MNDGYKDYLFEYPHGGAMWAFTIRATSEADARERMKALAFARYTGELYAVIPVPGSGAGFARFLSGCLAWLRHRLR